MRFPMNTCKGEETSWGKSNVIASLIGFLFFKQRFTFSHMLPLFQDNFILVEANSSRFFRVTTSTQQLLFWGSSEQLLFSPFSEQSLFCRSCFSFFFGAKILQNSHLLRIGGSLQLLFGIAFFSEELLRIKISKKELLFQSRYFCTASTFSGKLCFGKD